MTEKEQIQKQIQELQEKLKELEEKEPDMMLLRQGKVDAVDYNGKDGRKYIRIEYTDSFADTYSWYVRRVGEDAIRPIRDVNVYAPLEELYQKEVVKQKDDYPYKKHTPEETEQSLKEAFREAVKQGVVSSVGKSQGNFIDEMVEKIKGQTLYDICVKWNDEDDNPPVSVLIAAIEQWLPKEQSANSQNAYVECTVEGFNDCLQKIKSRLR